MKVEEARRLAAGQKLDPLGYCPMCSGVGMLTATDIFCGAGGSSLGLEHVGCPRCGRQLIQVTQALNHNPLAVMAHNENFPGADHDVHDVEVIPAARFRRTDILWASPSCVYFASTRGKKDYSEEAMRSRATFGDVVRFTEYHGYDAVIIENVIEARCWCEHDNCACGAEFDAWFTRMCSINHGYRGQIVYFNSQFALPTPQSRDRMYVVFVRNGIPFPALDFMPLSWCSNCDDTCYGVQTWKPGGRGTIREHIPEWGRYGAQYIYNCERCGHEAAPAVMGSKTIIDPTIPMEQIKNKPARHCNACGKHHPIACNTRARIRTGWEDIGRREPMAVQRGGNLYERIGKNGRKYARVWSLDGPIKTITGSAEMGLVSAMRDGELARALDEPITALTTRAQMQFIARMGGQAPAATRPDEPMNTITSHNRQIGFIQPNMENNTPRLTDEPLPAVTGGGRNMYVEPQGQPTDDQAAIVEMRNHGDAREVGRPMHTLCSSGTHHGLLVYNGTPGFVRETGDVAGTVTSRDKQSLLVPYFRTGVARPIGEPIGTITGRDRELLVTRDRSTFTVTDDMIDEAYLRMLQWPELLKAQVMHIMPDGSPYRLEATVRNARGKYVELSNEKKVGFIGNAVSAPVGTMLGGAVAEVLLFS